MKSERLIGSKHLSGGNAKQEGITNVPGGASHSDFDRRFHGAISHKGLAQSKRLLLPSPIAMACQANLLGMTTSKSAVDFQRYVSNEVEQDHQPFRIASGR